MNTCILSLSFSPFLLSVLSLVLFSSVLYTTPATWNLEFFVVCLVN